jgi:membrane peptidoglycan carboxypeptidase
MDDWAPRSGRLVADRDRPPAAAPRRRRRGGRGRRWPRRLAATVGALVLVFAVAAGVLFVATPGVGDAEQRATALDRSHGVADLTTPVAPRFVAALTATEDSRFFSDHGIDPQGVARAVWGFLGGGGGNAGGATLDQQLAKQLYFGGTTTGIGSIVEQLALAVKLDTTYSKQQILQMYASVVYFGNGYYGLEAASHGYFGVAPEQLGWGQAAMLAGLVQAPTTDNPVRHLAAATAREQHVLGRLVATGGLTQRQADAALAAPLNLVSDPGT